MARNPTCLSDSVEMYVEHQDVSSSLIAVSATATTSLTSSDVTNTVHKGVAFYITVSSLTVNTCTIGVNLKGKSAVTGGYFPLARVSIDGINATGSYSGIIHPSINSAVGSPTGSSATNGVVPATFQVQTSVTITTSASMSGTLGLRMDMCKIL